LAAKLMQWICVQLADRGHKTRMSVKMTQATIRTLSTRSLSDAGQTWGA
jgi:hypothetical protein